MSFGIYLPKTVEVAGQLYEVNPITCRLNSIPFDRNEKQFSEGDHTKIIFILGKVFEQNRFREVCRLTKERQSLVQLKSATNLPKVKLLSLLKKLRKAGVKIPFRKWEISTSQRKQFSKDEIIKFTQIIPQCYNVTHFAICCDISLDSAEYFLKKLQEKFDEYNAKHGTNKKMPEFATNPMDKYTLKDEIVWRGDKHGSGKHYKQKHAGYKRVTKQDKLFLKLVSDL